MTSISGRFPQIAEPASRETLSAEREASPLPCMWTGGVTEGTAKGHIESVCRSRVRVRGKRRLCANAGDHTQRHTDIRGSGSVGQSCRHRIERRAETTRASFELSMPPSWGRGSRGSNRVPTPTCLSRTTRVLTRTLQSPGRPMAENLEHLLDFVVAAVHGGILFWRASRFRLVAKAFNASGSSRRLRRRSSRSSLSCICVVRRATNVDGGTP